MKRKLEKFSLKNITLKIAQYLSTNYFITTASIPEAAPSSSKSPLSDYHENQPRGGSRVAAQSASGAQDLAWNGLSGAVSAYVCQEGATSSLSLLSRVSVIDGETHPRRDDRTGGRITPVYGDESGGNRIPVTLIDARNYARG